MNSFMISVSLGLQYGVPLEVYVSKFAHMRFEPSGPTNDPDIRDAKSIVDYVFRWMGKKFLTVDQQEEIGILSPEVRARLAPAYAAGAPEPPSLDAHADAGPDRALQHARGRDRVLPLRRPDGPRRHVLHVPRLRHVDRLRLADRSMSPGHGVAPHLVARRHRTGALPLARCPLRNMSFARCTATSASAATFATDGGTLPSPACRPEGVSTCRP